MFLLNVSFTTSNQVRMLDSACRVKYISFMTLGQERRLLIMLNQARFIHNVVSTTKCLRGNNGKGAHTLD
jgi:hypothetical protein